MLPQLAADRQTIQRDRDVRRRGQEQRRDRAAANRRSAIARPGPAASRHRPAAGCAARSRRRGTPRRPQAGACVRRCRPAGRSAPPCRWNSAAFSVVRASGRQALERVPHHGIAAHPLVDREVALEHAAVGAERLDAGLHERPPCRGEFARGRRQRLLVEREAADRHRLAAELQHHIGALRQLAQIAPPSGKRLVGLRAIRADADRAAAMIGADRLIGKRARQVDQFRQLRMIQRAFVRQPEPPQPSQPDAERRIHQQMLRRRRGRGHDDRRIPAGALADALEAAAAGLDVRLQHRVDRLAQAEVAIADDAGAGAHAGGFGAARRWRRHTRSRPPDAVPAAHRCDRRSRTG